MHTVHRADQPLVVSECLSSQQCHAVNHSEHILVLDLRIVCDIRFVRVPPSEAGSVVVVDHRHRALRVDGELWVGRGFYWPNTKALSLEDERAWMFYLAQQGINQLELGLNERSPENTTRILKMAESLGIKVMFSVVSTVDHIMNCTGRSVCNSEAEITQGMQRLWTFVDAHKTSPALLSWYICDDCPCGGDAASDAKRHALSFVYSRLKQRDPFHITSGAGGCGNMYALGEPYALRYSLRDSPIASAHSADPRGLQELRIDRKYRTKQNDEINSVAICPQLGSHNV